ncbi:MAG: guanylate kinase [Lachnospiraceae bacterium]|nr:guanylate kinase [Lachnospiraceae bacterium]
MGKIVYLMGKSSTGKDTIFKELLESGTIALKTIVPYTTRPIRAGEQDGVEYFFTDEEGFQKLLQQGKIIEERAYHTVHGLWRYFTVDDEQLQLSEQSYIMIGTLEAYQNMKKYYGQESMLPVMIELDDGIRLQRALDRERQQENPKYEELCRRFLADSADFAEDKMLEAGITRRFQNDNLQRCLDEIVEYIKENLS